MAYFTPRIFYTCWSFSIQWIYYLLCPWYFIIDSIRVRRVTKGFLCEKWIDSSKL